MNLADMEIHDGTQLLLVDPEALDKAAGGTGIPAQSCTGSRKAMKNKLLPICRQELWPEGVQADCQ